MKCNVGKTEQAIRITIGSAIVLTGLFYRSWWGFLGVAPIITGAIRYCPLNSALGINNCDAAGKKKDKELVFS